MTNLIILKTDASYKPDVGSGVSYNSKIIHNGVHQRSISNNTFIEDVENSTQAELLAVVFGVMDTYMNIDEVSEYEIAIKSDCEYAVDIFDGTHLNQPLKRFVLFFLRNFGGWRINWIPRSVNSKADGLARSALTKGEEK